MHTIELINLIPYFLSLIICFAVGLFTFRRRQVLGAMSFSLIIAIEVLTLVGYILELITPSLQNKMFWDNFQWYTTLIYPITLQLFTFEYIAKLNKKVGRFILGLFIVAVLIASIISFNIFPEIGNRNPRLVISQPFSLYTYEFGLITLLAALFTYTVTIAGIALLIIELLKQPKHFRIQSIIIILGISIPVFASVFTLIGIVNFPNRDIAPLTFAIANLIIGYGLFRYRIFDLIPIARAMVMDHMNDPVIILNQKDEILDGNQSFAKLIGKNKKLFVNKSIHSFISTEALQKCDDLEVVDAQDEGLVHYGDNIGYFEISVKTFSNRLGVYSGRLVIMHDLTTRKLSENQLLLSKDILEENAAVRALELEQLNTLLVNEVAERKKAEKEKDNYAQEMEVLFNLAIEISELNPEVDIEEFLASRIKEINQAFFVVLSEYDPKRKVLYTKHIIMDEQSMEKVIEIIGEDPRLIYLPVSESTYQHITKEVVLYRQSLNQSFYGVIDPKVGERIQQTFDLDQFVGVSIQSNGKLTASLVIALQKNKTVPSAKFYESLSNLASVVFWRKKA